MPFGSAPGVESFVRLESTILPCLAPRLLTPLPSTRALPRSRSYKTWQASEHENGYAAVKPPTIRLQHKGQRRNSPLALPHGRPALHTTYAFISTFIRDQARSFTAEAGVLEGPGAAEAALEEQTQLDDLAISTELAEEEGNAGSNASAGDPSQLHDRSHAKIRRRFVGPTRRSAIIQDVGNTWYTDKRARQYRDRAISQGQDPSLLPSINERRQNLRRAYVDSLIKGQSFSLQQLRDHRQDLIWFKGFAILNARYDSRTADLAQLPPITYHPDTSEWVEKQYESENSKEWVELSRPARAMRRSNILLWLLERSPVRALHFLEFCVKQDPPIPIHAVDDSLRYILRALKQVNNDGKAGLSEFIPCYLRILSRCAPLRSRLDHKWIWNLISISTREEQAQLYWKIKFWLSSKFVALHTHFALNYALLGRSEDAIGALSRVLDGGLEPNSEKFHKYCAFVLRECGKQAGQYRTSTEIASWLLREGVKFGIHHYNIIMLNAIEAGDPRTAFSVNDMLEENGISPDAYTYSILLKAGKGSDLEVMNNIESLCSKMAITLRNPVIASEYLHHRFLRLGKWGSRPFPIMLATYSRFFDLAPLQRLGIISSETVAEAAQNTETSQNPGFPVMAPEPAALFLAVASRLQHSSRETPDSLVAEVYNNFRDLVLQGDPEISPLAETTHMYNAFLLAFCQRENLLKHAPSIVRDMNTGLPATSIHQAKQRPIVPAVPDVQTWTILLNGFLKHKQPAAAEKVMELMKQRGLEPSKVTWEILLAGYANIQDIEGAVWTMAQMEEKGYELEEKSLRSLSRIVDRERLMQAMESKDDVVNRMPLAG